MTTDTRRFPKLTEPRAAAIAMIVAQTQGEIIRDVFDGRVPLTASTFSELHDYVDANLYAELTVERLAESLALDVVDLLNPVTDLVDQWLQVGELVRAIKGAPAHPAIWEIEHTGGGCYALRCNNPRGAKGHLLAHNDLGLPRHGEDVEVAYFLTENDAQSAEATRWETMKWGEWLEFRRYANPLHLKNPETPKTATKVTMYRAIIEDIADVVIVHDASLLSVYGRPHNDPDAPYLTFGLAEVWSELMNENEPSPQWVKDVRRSYFSM